MKGGTAQQQDDAALEDRQEMNELVDSDPELYAGDVEDMYLPDKNKKAGSQRERDKLKAEIQGHLNSRENENAGVFTAVAANDVKVLNQVHPDEISLMDPEDEQDMMKEVKEYQSKIHNSFTGPYPLDPTEFSHTDKG